MSSTDCTDDELAQRLRCGDEDALAELFSKHRDRLLRAVSFRMGGRLRQRVDPDDVLQEAYLAAAQRIEHYAAQDVSPFVWLHMIAKQTMIDVHRRHIGAQKRDAGREVAIDGVGNAQSTSASIAVHLVAARTSPSQAAVRADLVEKVKEALEQMDAIDQEILALRHFEEMTNSEAAETLGIEQKAASIRYVRAIKRLKAVMHLLPGASNEAHGG